MQERYVEALEKKLTAPSTATATAPDAIDSFLASLKPCLESLKMTSRLKAQQKMLNVMTEALEKEEEDEKNK